MDNVTVTREGSKLLLSAKEGVFEKGALISIAHAVVYADKAEKWLARQYKGGNRDTLAYLNIECEEFRTVVCFQVTVSQALRVVHDMRYEVGEWQLENKPQRDYLAELLGK